MRPNTPLTPLLMALLGLGAGLAAGVAASAGGTEMAPSSAPPLAMSAQLSVVTTAGGAEMTPPQAEEDAVLAAVQRFFDALGEGPEALRETLIAEGPVSRFRITEDGVSWQYLSFDEMMSGGRDGRVLERMWDATVLVQEPIAQVWTPYDLYVDGAFSHCGIDSFTLIKRDDGWTVAGVAFTVQQTGCPESPLGPPR